ncbi:MAG: hypothetical protein ACXVEF_35350 [Polyangiales bacterium]
MTLPYSDVVTAVRTAASEAGRLHVDKLSEALRKTKPAHAADAANLLTRLGPGNAPDPVAIRELTVEIAAMPEAARSLVCVLAPALASESALVGRALLGISAACGAAIGAVVPLATVIDATLLEACRDAGAQWNAGSIAQKKGNERAEELARRVARALGVKIENETPEQSADRLQKLDLEVAASKARAAEIEKKLRASLPKV